MFRVFSSGMLLCMALDMVIRVGFFRGAIGAISRIQCSSKQAGFACGSNQRGEPQLRGGSGDAGTGLDNRWLGNDVGAAEAAPKGVRYQR